MNRTVATLAAGAIATAFAIAPAAAQSLPPPGNVNPGSLNSGAEETGAENQPRSFGPYDYRTMAPRGYAAPDYAPDAYAPQPGVTYGPFAPAYGPFGRGGANAIGADDN